MHATGLHTSVAWYIDDATTIHGNSLLLIAFKYFGKKMEARTRGSPETSVSIRSNAQHLNTLQSHKKSINREAVGDSPTEKPFWSEWVEF
jgi:hypothetical protein